MKRDVMIFTLTLLRLSLLNHLINNAVKGHTVNADSSQHIGRSTNDSLCTGTFYMSMNSTLELKGDGYSIDPPCVVAFIVDERLTDTCVVLTNIEIPCDYESNMRVQTYSVGITEKEIFKRDKKAFMQYDYTCSSNKGPHALCTSDPPFAVVVRMSVTSTKEQYTKALPSLFLSFIKTKIPHDRKDTSCVNRNSSPTPMTDTNKRYSVVNDCDCNNPNCNCDTNVVKNLKSNGSDQQHKQPTKKGTGVDVNIVITVVGGIITSLFIPIILLLVRSYVQRKSINIDAGKNSSTEDDDEMITIADESEKL